MARVEGVCVRLKNREEIKATLLKNIEGMTFRLQLAIYTYLEVNEHGRAIVCPPRSLCEVDFIVKRAIKSLRCKQRIVTRYNKPQRIVYSWGKGVSV